MAIYFLDPEAGNDANDGSSFALRKKSLASLTAAMLAPGDTIRVIASPDPVSTGVDATWTNGARTVTLASAVTQTVDNCTTAWTASANVTCSANASATRKYDGAAVSAFVFATAFTTGKVAYKTLAAPLDLSAYEVVSLWVYTSTSLAAGTLELRLCSDAAGDVPVHVVPLQEAAAAGGSWRVVLKDFAAALATSIQSVALFANSDPGTSTVYLQNIVASKDLDAADGLNHLSLIRPADGDIWYPVAYLDGATIGLGHSNSIDWTSASMLPRPLVGATVTNALHKRRPLDLINGGGSAPPGATAGRALQDNGALDNPITISGGWDRATMAAQTGESWLSGSHWAGSALTIGALDYVNVEKIAACHFTSESVTIASGAIGIALDLVAAVGGTSPVLPSGGTSYLTIRIGYVNACSASVNLASAPNGNCDVQIGAIRNCPMASSSQVILSGAGRGYQVRVRVPVVDNCGGAVVALSNGDGEFILSDVVATNMGGAAFAVYASNPGPAENVHLINCSFNGAPLVLTATGAMFDDGRGISVTANGHVASAHARQRYYQLFESDSTVRHTESDIAWKLSVGHATNRHALRPAEEVIGRYYASASQAITMRAWMRRSSVSLACGIKVKGGSIAGVPADVLGAMTAAIDTWEEVSLTITPTIDGVVELWGWAYGAIADCRFDDLSVTA